AERIDGIRYAGLVGDDLLRSQRNRCGEFRGKRPSLIERIGVQRLRSAKNRGERLQRRAHDVVIGLLRRKRAASRLRVEAERPGTRVLRAVALNHSLVPNAARGAALRNLLEEVAMRVEEEGKLRHEFVHVQAAP